MVYTIRPIITGYMPVPRASVIYHESVHKFYETGGAVQAPAIAYYIEGAGHKILVDTGMSATESAEKFHVKGAFQPLGFAIDEQLSKMGVDIAEIDTIILTHLHWDHCSNIQKFKHAKIYVQKSEYEFAMDPLPIYHIIYEHPARGFQRSFHDLPVELIDGNRQILAGIEVISTPGHSIGHQAIAVNTAHGTYYCCGDLAFCYDNFKEQTALGFPITPPARYQCMHDLWNSIVKIKAAADSIEKILLCHEVPLESNDALG